MSRQLKPYINRLRDLCTEHGLYQERNETLIRDVALLELMRDDYVDAIKENGPIIRQIGSQGQTKIQLNPVYIELRKVLANIINGKSKLGFSNATAGGEDEERNEILEEFLRM